MPKMGASRRPSRQVLIALGLVVVATFTTVATVKLLSPHKAVLVTVKASSQGGSCPTGYPGKPTPPCSYQPPPPPPAAHVACTKGGLRLSEMWPSAYQGYAGESIELISTNDAPCYLVGAPPMKVSATSGVTESVSRGDLVSKRVDLQPGEDLFMIIGSPGTCSNTANNWASSVTLTLPGGTMAISGLRFGVMCGAPHLLIFGAAPIPMYPPTNPSGSPSKSGVPLSKSGAKSG